MSKFFWAARIGARGRVWLRSFAGYLGRARDFVRAGALRGGGVITVFQEPFGSFSRVFYFGGGLGIKILF